MINIVIYNLIDGDILRCVTCPIEMADIQCQEGEGWLEHERVNDIEYRVELTTLQVIPIS